jgi:hypothetical protein
MDWGDPNLWFQGLGSAIVGGVVAALTALLVVKLTNNKNRALARELDARGQATTLLRATNEFAAAAVRLARNTDEMAEERNRLLIRWAAETMATAPAIIAADPAFDATINGRLKEVRAADKALEELGPRDRAQNEEAWAHEAERLSRGLTHGLTDFAQQLGEWLHDRP